jgi:hypothetical protein
MRPIRIIDRGRGPELAHIRITVYDVLPYHLAGDDPTYIAASLLLSTPEVQALIDYYEAHKEEVMEVHRRIEERIARGNPPEIEERLRDSPAHALIQARMEELRKRRSRQETNGEGNPE